MNTYVIGFMGSDRIGLAERLASESGRRWLSLDEEIEKCDGRSIKKICMACGEHGYRNLEYQMLCELKDADLIIACGDGILLDDDCRAIICSGQAVHADADAGCDALWERARCDSSIPYAFMSDPDDAARKAKFTELYNKRKHLYEEVVK